MDDIDYCGDCGALIDMKRDDWRKVIHENKSGNPITSYPYLMCGNCYEQASDDGRVGSPATLRGYTDRSGQ